MGMFDYFCCSEQMPNGYVMPDTNNSRDWYQTKSLDCALECYELDGNRRLCFRNESVPEAIAEHGLWPERRTSEHMSYTGLLRISCEYGQFVAAVFDGVVGKFYLNYWELEETEPETVKRLSKYA